MHLAEGKGEQDAGSRVLPQQALCRTGCLQAVQHVQCPSRAGTQLGQGHSQAWQRSGPVWGTEGCNKSPDSSLQACIFSCRVWQPECCAVTGPQPGLAARRPSLKD